MYKILLTDSYLFLTVGPIFRKNCDQRRLCFEQPENSHEGKALTTPGKERNRLHEIFLEQVFNSYVSDKSRRFCHCVASFGQSKLDKRVGYDFVAVCRDWPK